MAGECDQMRLLSDDAISTSPTRFQPRKMRLQTAAVAAIAGVAAVAALRKSFGAPVADSSDIGGVISAEALIAAAHAWTDPTKCTGVGISDTYVEVGEVKNMFWPHRFDDVNWQEHCGTDVTKHEDCVSRLIEKYVGDYFDKVVGNVKAGDADQDWMPHDNEREMERWKKRVIKSIQDKSKYLKRIEDPQHAPLEWAHKNLAVDFNAIVGNPTFPPVSDPCGDKRKCTQDGWICDAMREQRPISAKSADSCGANYNPWETVSAYFTTDVPTQSLCNMDTKVCDSFEKEPANAALDTTKVYQQPGELDLKNEKLAACKHLLQPLKGEDWISATLTALDVRECIASGGAKPKNPYSRAWVRNCLPARADQSLVSVSDEPRVVGWPGFVLEFISEYQIPESDCVKDYEGDLDTKGACPATCEDGTSLTGHLRRYTSLKNYRVIYNRRQPAVDPKPLHFWNLNEVQLEFARYLIWKNGPLIGLVEQTRELVDCTRDDIVLFADKGCDKNADWDDTTGTGLPLENMASVTVYGWGTLAGKPYWSFVSAFQPTGRILVCGVKALVVPLLEQATIQSDFYDKALNAFKAESVCNRGEGFCKQATAGYTASEDCDGDGVLDHWCYLAGEPTYEAFISSGEDCTVVERSCRRSVLPGRTFGCQRPLGWCMHDEIYKRNVDCDGDGHFDHVCEKFGHAGFISSSQDCIDTWEEGTEGKKCEPQLALLDADASITYKLVHDAGDCMPHPDHGSVCFKSHEAWPKSNYKPSSNCKFHVEATNHKFPRKEEADCGKDAVPETQLLLEVLYLDAEEPQYDLNGAFFGDKFVLSSVGVKNVPIGMESACVGDGSCIDWRPLAESIWPVYDQSVVEFSSDQTVEKEGWLVCLRERSKIPEIYIAGCSEIGDDIWRKLNNVRKTKTWFTVECDMDKCHKGTVSPMSPDDKNRFYRTTNVCDAGWTVARGDKFDVQFSSPATFDNDAGGSINEPSFSVLA